MGDPFKFAERAPSGRLADAAGRMERVVNTVKDQQLARTRSGARRPESEAYVLSPEEAWSKKYMIQCVGPVCTIRPTSEGALLLPRFAPAPPRAAAPHSHSVAASAEAPAAAAKPARKAARKAAEPIGLAIGKPIRKRSWLGRMFRP